MYRTFEEEQRAKRREWQREHDAELADKFGEALGISDVEPEVLTLDDLTTRAEPSGASSE